MENNFEEISSAVDNFMLNECNLDNIFNSIVRIEYTFKESEKYGTGFFIKIPNLKSNLYFNFILTSEHVIPENLIEEKGTIYIFFGNLKNEEIKSIDLDKEGRYIKCDTKYEYTIIQILEQDKFYEAQYLLPDLNYKNEYEFYKDIPCHLAGYIKSNEKIETFISNGKIIKINEDNKFEYYSENINDLSGIPIFLKSDLLVFGIHNHYDKTNLINYGIFIGVILDEINNEEILNKINFFEDKNDIILDKLKEKEYKITEKIRRDEFGTVYKLEKDNKYYSFTKLPINNLSKYEIGKISGEIKIISELNHENIVKYYDSFIEKDYLNIIMEYDGNYNLKQLIKNHKNKGKLINENIIKKILIQICSGLKEIHQNILVHKDLTPYNIFINDSYIIKIGEFGIIKKLKSQLNYSIINPDKLHYTAPEIELGEKFNYKTDMYSLGCIIYELFPLNEYYIDKDIFKKDCKIDINKYNPNWQELIDCLVKKTQNERPNIEEIYDKYIKANKITLTLEIEKCNIYKKIFFMDCVIFNSKEMNEINTEIFINDTKHEYKKYFIPEKEGLYTIKIILYFYIKDCSYMFSECHQLKNIDLSKFEAKNVINMKSMFYNCVNLENVYLSKLKTQNVSDISFMFYNCEKLKSIDLSSFNTQNIINMSNMFDHCCNLDIINLSSFNVKNVINMEYMFSHCNSLICLDLSSFVNFSNTSMYGIFYNCNNLIKLKAKKNFINKMVKDNPDYKNKNFFK